jgi:hypothetical protein
MRASLLVTVASLLVVAGCAASPANRAAVPPAQGQAAPHPGLAAAVPAGSDGTQAAQASDARRRRDEPGDDRVTRQRNRALGWVFLSVGAEAAVVATITSFIMLHESSLRSADCPDKVCSPAGLSANVTLHNLEWWNAGAWGVAVVGVGVGAVVLWTNPSDAALHAEVAIAPTGSGSGLRLRGTF